MRDLSKLYTNIKKLVSEKHKENPIKTFADFFNPLYFDDMIYN